jgi:uncharacterized repeat protein (TIGR04052 family)
LWLARRADEAYREYGEEAQRRQTQKDAANYVTYLRDRTPGVRRMNVRVINKAFALAMLLISGCTAPREPVEIPFEVRFGDRAIACDSAISGTTLTDLRLYVHDVRLVAESGAETAVRLQAAAPWQNEDVTLLDFEDGKAGCRNGTPRMNTVVRGLSGKDAYSGLRFRIGVPEHLNHANPLLAEAPLNDSTMHWHWRTGYKFLRAGVASESDGFWLHLGSARCEGTVNDIAGCASPNRPDVDLPGFVPGKHAVVIDLSELVAAVDLEDGVLSDCSSGPAERSCAAPFLALGIDFESGRSSAGSPVFRLEAAR